MGFLTVNMRNASDSMSTAGGGAADPQTITAVAMNASENTAVGEHKSTVSNVSLWYAPC